MKLLKKILVFIFLLCSFTSCVSTGRFTSFTKEKVAEIEVRANVPLPEYVGIDIDTFLFQEDLVKVQKIKSFFIPAIVYWQLEHTLKCDLDPKIPVKIFEQEFISFADSVNLGSRLKGQKLELSILNIPHGFIYTHKEAALLFVIAVVNAMEAIYPDNNTLKVSYRLLDRGQEKKTGVITIRDANRPLGNVLRSTRKFTFVYLDQYRKACNLMNEQLFDRLITELGV